MTTKTLPIESVKKISSRIISSNNWLSVTKRNITTLVDGLEGDGLAMRRPHPTDRRSKLVALTKDGEATFREAAKFQRKHLESLIANLEPAQQDVLVSALVQLTDAITTKRGA